VVVAPRAGTAGPADANTDGGGDAPKPAAPSAVFSTDPAPSARSSVAELKGDIQILFLPDMDEQYAIQSKNVFSKSSFGLQFRHGWELTDVSGNHDSTPVALELFATINSAVDAAKALSTSALSSLAG